MLVQYQNPEKLPTAIAANYPGKFWQMVKREKNGSKTKCARACQDTPQPEPRWKGTDDRAPVTALQNQIFGLEANFTRGDTFKWTLVKKLG